MFFAIAQLFGAFGSHWYVHLTGIFSDRNSLFVGYIVGAVVMILSGVISIFRSVDREGSPSRTEPRGFSSSYTFL